MSDIKKIIEALAALAKAQSAYYVTINAYEFGGMGVSLAHRSDTDARATATELGIELVTVGNEETEWLHGGADIGPVSVSVYGPHHKRARKVDVAAADRALAQVQEALS